MACSRHIQFSRLLYIGATSSKYARNVLRPMLFGIKAILNCQSTICVVCAIDTAAIDAIVATATTIGDVRGDNNISTKHKVLTQSHE